MTDDTEPSLNPHFGKVIGFVDKQGNLADTPQEDQFDLLINVGEDDDVKEKGRVLIFTLGPEVKDPDTGESLGHFEIVKGEGRVSVVQARMSIITSTGTRTEQYLAPSSNNPFGGSSLSDLLKNQQYQTRQIRTPFRGPKVGDLVRFI